MTDVRTNAGELARSWQQRGAALPSAVRRGTRDVILTVERHAAKRLTGGGEAAPGSYPVPIRTGHLRRSLGSRLLGDASGMVFNRAIYASAIHNGMLPYNNPAAAARTKRARPFLDDAVLDTPADEIMRKRLQQAVFA